MKSTIEQVVEAVVSLEEAVVRRMLCHWNPAWGQPRLVRGPSNTSVSILGLARLDGPAGEILVSALDHIGPDNQTLPPEGPWPLPDDRQWRAWSGGAAEGT